jgi:hypothetical protein
MAMARVAKDSGTIQRGDDRLGAGVDRPDDRGQRGILGGLAELADVGVGDEGAAGADQHRGGEVGPLG